MNKNLAQKTRPIALDDFVCNDSQRFLFEKIIANDDFRSFIFYGKPGTGKTTISYILASSLKVSFDYFNAAIEKKEDLVAKLKLNKILIIDEIHRLNKDKQDILLPYIENDLITIYATTTENPYFKVNPALRSRCAIVEIKNPSIDDLSKQLKKIALNNQLDSNLSDEIYHFIASQSNGDYRSAINSLDLISTLSKTKKLTLDEIKKILPAIQFTGDSNGDAHFDHLSAFHKSLRGSDPNAALYYGFILVESGDFDGLFRRMICAAYEDVGLANPNLPVQVMNAIDAFERLGLPEGYLPIANAILEIALSPKSNSAYLAYHSVLEDLRSGQLFEVPNHLKDSSYSSAKKLKRGVEYLYPHNFDRHYVKQDYLPSELKNKQYYCSQKEGFEEKINEYWRKLKGE